MEKNDIREFASAILTGLIKQDIQEYKARLRTYLTPDIMKRNDDKYLSILGVRNQLNVSILTLKCLLNSLKSRVETACQLHEDLFSQYERKEKKYALSEIVCRVCGFPMKMWENEDIKCRCNEGVYRLKSGC